MLVADAIVKTLKDEEVEIVFGICGGYLFWLLRGFETAGIRTIPSRHEGAAAFMSAGYAQASGKIGVVFGQGPGAINLLTGVASAYVDSVPMLAIASQAPTSLYAADSHQEATGSNFGVDQLPAFRTMTRAQFRVPSAVSALRSTQRALAIANGERGPVMLEVPSNILGEEINPTFIASEQYRVEAERVDVAAVAEAAALLTAAKRPVLVIGNRATHRGIADDLRALCERNELPFVVMDYAKGIIPEDHPLYAGVVGWCGHEAAHTYVESADLVITLGARLDSKSTTNYDASLYKNLVQIDDTASEIGRNFPFKLGVLGDIPATVRALLDATSGAKIERSLSADIAELRREHHTYDEAQATSTSDKLGSAHVMHVLRKLLPRQTQVVGDSGLNLHYLKRFFPVHAPDGFFCLYGWAAMGSGLPVAMGVQIAKPDDVVLSVIGDGGLLVYAGEMQIMAEYNLPVIVVCMNNAGYSQVSSYMSKFIGSEFGCAIQEIDAAKIAQGFGCDGYTVRTSQELETAVKTALQRRRPTVIDVKLTGDNLEDVMLPRVEGFVGSTYAKKK
ncbi:MAG TPA: thiamine pyrophosphate-binding protein [Kofleriaceae bacterium]|jgi:acetolactate synthase-1/2/3 large subunit